MDPLSLRIYRKMESLAERKPALGKLLPLLDRGITGAVFLSYPLLLLWIFLKGEASPVPFILVPGVSFVVVSLFRKLVNRPRPYEVYDYTPLIHKETRGKSFPSRHAFSIFMIAMTFHAAGLSVAAGIIGVLGLLLAALRVMGGVHFVKDVVAGAVLGILCGIMGFWIVGPGF